MTFTFDQNSSYQTLIGVFVSSIIHLVILVISILSIIMILNRRNTSTSIDKIAKDLTNDLEKQYFAKNNDAYFALKLTSLNSQKLLDKSYFTFQIQQNGYL